MFGLEAGLFFPTGTQSNLAALMAHCGRGEEVIVGQDAHTYRYEGGGAAVLGSIQPQPLANLPDGTLDLAMVEAAIKPDDPHFAVTRLLALENTIGGKVIGRDYLAKAVTLAWKRGLSTHLDGARIFNAAVKLGMPVNALCAGFDTVSVCLSKGLGAPAGTVLVGHQGLVDKARRIRKMLGGGHAAGRNPRGRGPVRARAPRDAPGRGPRQRASASRRGWRRPGSKSSRRRPTWSS